MNMEKRKQQAELEQELPKTIFDVTEMGYKRKAIVLMAGSMMALFLAMTVGNGHIKILSNS